MNYTLGKPAYDPAIPPLNVKAIQLSKDLSRKLLQEMHEEMRKVVEECERNSCRVRISRPYISCVQR